MHEWALLIMTVAVQTAIGGMLFLWIAGNLLKKNQENDLYKIMKWPLVVLAVISVVGLLASFFHLGKPTHAINAIRGFGSSWMSNEIVITGLFIALVCMTAAWAIWKKKVNLPIMLVAALVGLADIFCMAQLYRVTRVSGWEHINTYLVFYGTAFALGAVLGIVLLAKALKIEDLKNLLKIAFAISLFGIIIQLAGTAMFTGYVGEMQLIDSISAAEKLSGYTAMIGLRWVIEGIGLLALGYTVLGSLQKKMSVCMLYAAVAMILVAEGMGRYVFYVLGA